MPKGQKKKRGESPHDGHSDIRAVAAKFYKTSIFIHNTPSKSLAYYITKRKRKQRNKGKNKEKKPSS